MDFPSFGDAAAYDHLGRACAAAIAGPAAVFDGCYHPLRPIGSALLMAAPYLAAGDPVEAAYMAVALNVAFLAATVAAVASVLAGDDVVLPGLRRRAAWIAWLAFAALLPNLTAHVPVRLGDLPSLALFAAALPVAMGLRRDDGSAPRRYAACGLLVALAVLVKVTYLAYGLVLLASMLALDPHARGRRARRAAAFLVALAPVAIQVAWLYAHTGQVGLYDREHMRRFFDYPRREYGIESVIFTVPEPGVHLTQVEGGVNRANVVLLRLYRGIFGFEWSVYLGEPSRPALWTLTAGELARAWAMVLGYFAFSGWVAWRGAPALRLLSLNAAAGALVTAVLMHTELRYYALPRAVLWLTLGIALASALRSARVDQETQRAP